MGTCPLKIMHTKQSPKEKIEIKQTSNILSNRISAKRVFILLLTIIFIIVFILSLLFAPRTLNFAYSLPNNSVILATIYSLNNEKALETEEANEFFRQIKNCWIIPNSTAKKCYSPYVSFCFENSTILISNSYIIVNNKEPYYFEDFNNEVKNCFSQFDIDCNC